MLVGNVEVMVLKPTRGAPPQGSEDRGDLRAHRAGEVEPQGGRNEARRAYELGGRQPPEARFRSRTIRTRAIELLEQVADKDSDGKTITEKWIKVHLVFQAPTDKKLKFLHLTLPAAAFQADGPMIGFEINPNDIEAAEGRQGRQGGQVRRRRFQGGDGQGRQERHPRDGCRLRIEMILFECPYCAAQLEIGEDRAGRSMTCPFCKGQVEVPKPHKPRRQRTEYDLEEDDARPPRIFGLGREC